MAENFPEWLKDTSPQIHELQQISSKYSSYSEIS